MEEIIKKKKWREYLESLLFALLIAFFVRSFGIEAFRIPSGSMIPTLLVGDHIFVNKFIYGLRVPFTKKRIVEFRIPERGEAIVFMFPLDEGKDYIKRVIGLPGDLVEVEGNEIIVNGNPISKEPVPEEKIPRFNGKEDYLYFQETQGPTSYLVQYEGADSFYSRKFQVPPNHLFVMGDNRDNSLDSRAWGFVPMENVKGKAMFIWLSLDLEDGFPLRFRRFGKWIK